MPDTSPIKPVSTAGFDAKAVFEPAVSPSTVVFTGSATNATTIASIEVYDGSTDLGSVSGFRYDNSSWSFQATLGASGLHFIHATVTEFSGATYGLFAPYQIVTGVKNQPYVYQELDQTGSVVTSVSDYDGSGKLVSQTAVAVNGGAAAPLSIAFDPTATYLGPTAATLTGTTTAYGSVSSIEIFDGPVGSVVDPRTGKIAASAIPLGYATVSPNGTWTFDAHVSPGQHEFTAVATSAAGVSANAQSPFDLVAGVVGKPFVWQEIDHGAKGAVVATRSYAQDGTVVGRSDDGGLSVNGGTATGQVFNSTYDDVMTGDGTGGTTFVFKRGFGQDEITNFNYLNPTPDNGAVPHDVISLPQSVFTTLAQVIRHTTSALDGDAVIHLNKQDSIKLDGVSKADLITHSNLFRFHS